MQERINISVKKRQPNSKESTCNVPQKKWRAYDHYAINAIRFSALDYLVKPVEIDELKAAVSKAEVNQNNRSSSIQLELLMEYLEKKQPRRITIPTAEGLQFISLEDIVYFEASDNYTNIYLSSKKNFWYPAL